MGEGRVSGGQGQLCPCLSGVLASARPEMTRPDLYVRRVLGS